METARACLFAIARRHSQGAGSCPNVQTELRARGQLRGATTKKEFKMYISLGLLVLIVILFLVFR